VVGGGTDGGEISEGRSVCGGAGQHPPRVIGGRRRDDFIVHEDQLADAAPGWIGESAKALSEVTARWETRHTQHKRRTGELSYHMATVRTAFTTNEEHSARALSAIDPR
jgi:hypothetical protein